MDLNIPLISREPLSISLNDGERIFVVGTNGSGKSALIQHLVASHRNDKIRRIPAHRQSWFQTGSINITPQNRREFDRSSRRAETQDDARWMDHYADERQSVVLFDLVAKENNRARLIAGNVDKGEIKEAENYSAKSKSPFNELNDLLRLGTLAVTLQNSNDEEILAERHGVSETYSIAQMSDGERNAAIIAATVLTVEAGTLLIIDEPERHLHRSIIEPFLSALFAQRRDCSFILSTHEVALPISDPKARVLIVRSCQWNNNRADKWDVELLESNLDLPEDLKRAILGSRKRILFVEGTPNSLDLPLYNALFPDISVVPRENCVEVERSVKGLRGSSTYHHVEAFGLIDRDDRCDSNVSTLRESGVFALEVYSVESIYYCEDAIEAVAHRQAESLSCNANDMKREAIQQALEAMTQNDFAERMAARRCERRLRNRILSQIPSWKSIQTNATPTIDISIDSPYQDELAKFNKLVCEEKWDELVARYPLRESGAFGSITKALKLTGRDIYEQTLISRIQADSDLADRLRQRIKPLSDAFNSTLSQDT